MKGGSLTHYNAKQDHFLRMRRSCLSREEMGAGIRLYRETPDGGENPGNDGSGDLKTWRQKRRWLWANSLISAIMVFENEE
jgi:hypothetical protein